jgi:hypothetical protein
MSIAFALLFAVAIGWQKHPELSWFHFGLLAAAVGVTVGLGTIALEWIYEATGRDPQTGKKRNAEHQ